MGITEKPIKARFTAKSHSSLGSVTKPSKMKPTAQRAVELIMSLNFCVLSKTMPRTKDPVTPKKIKTPPKTAFYAPPYPKGPVIAATTAPRLV